LAATPASRKISSAVADTSFADEPKLEKM
jgi:hypothetical protein